jgi:minimal PKS chain-length factor (CLF/KS beta)
MRWSLLGRLNTTDNDTPEKATRPYDVTAAGTVIAEGGAVLVIEELEHARARGATVYAEVVGLGASANGAGASTVIDPEPTGEALAAAMNKSLRAAGIEARQVGVVVPSSYSIPSWDRADAAALKRVFGEKVPPILAARAGVGDCGAGAQALDLVAAVMALKEQTLPPTANVREPLEGLPIVQEKRGAALDYAAVLTSALGGQNSAVILKKAGTA